MRSLTSYMDRAGDYISDHVEQETGRVTLTFFSDDEEAKVTEFWRAGKTPRAAADQIMADRVLDSES